MRSIPAQAREHCHIDKPTCHSAFVDAVIQKTSLLRRQIDQQQDLGTCDRTSDHKCQTPIAPMDQKDDSCSNDCPNQFCYQKIQAPGPSKPDCMIRFGDADLANFDLHPFEGAAYNY